MKYNYVILDRTDISGISKYITDNQHLNNKISVK